jgi:hypothetical protein
LNVKALSIAVPRAELGSPTKWSSSLSVDVRFWPEANMTPAKRDRLRAVFSFWMHLDLN